MELQMPELNIFGAALAPVSAGAAVVGVLRQFLRRHLQLAVLTGHQTAGALLLLEGRKRVTVNARQLRAQNGRYGHCNTTVTVNARQFGSLHGSYRLSSAVTITAL